MYKQHVMQHMDVRSRHATMCCTHELADALSPFTNIQHDRAVHNLFCMEHALRLCVTLAPEAQETETRTKASCYTTCKQGVQASTNEVGLDEGAPDRGRGTKG